MAIEYKGPKAVLPIMMEGSIKPRDYWEDFRSKVLQEDSNYNFTEQYNKEFRAVTKDWDAQKLLKFFDDNGITEAVRTNAGVELGNILQAGGEEEAAKLYKRILGSMVMDKKGHFSNIKYKLSGTEISNLRKGMQAYDAHEKLIDNLKEKGGTDDQIQGILDSRDGSAEGFESLLDDIENLSGDDWKQYARDNFLKGKVLPDNTWGDGESEASFTFSEAEGSAANPPTDPEVAEQVISNYAFGESNLDTLKASDNVYEKDGVYYEKGTDKELVQADDGSIVYADGSGRWSEGGLEPEIESDGDRSDDAEEVISTSLENLAEAGDTSADIQTSITGGDVSTGVADQLGWKKQPDGSYKAKDGTVYKVDPKTGMLLEADGKTVVRTEGTMNFAENDFAQDYENAANDFLFGAAISEQAAQSLGFTKTNTGYTGPDGEPYTVDANGNLVNADNEVARSDGFLDYQTQMTEANAEYVTRMEGADGRGGLLAEYDKAYTDYSNELRPRMDSLDANTAALNEVARDANSPDYYNRLSQLYYDESKDEINRSTRGAQETLQSTYANAGMDPSSPAYTKAIMDLQNKRSESMVSARRKAILDSYGLGSDMLKNRQSALNSAQTGIRYGMDALGELYDVKLEGLGVEKDMVSTVYEGKKEGAKLGMEGLGVMAGVERDKIGARETKFYKDIDLRTGLNTNTITNNTSVANTAGNVDAAAEDDVSRGVGFLQNLIDNNVDMQLFGTALQTQFKDDPDALNFLTPEQKQMLGIGT